ncbi:DUF1272 domain-containing protein [Priestia koreensis]|uniref:DUF1272 domain-containing protein n=1 Tax=Priestia koreensis TaxID=284581 RepID=UPI0009FAAFB0|nr:DUF1272 domain-containing protein [Priestia koreensis]
MALEMKSHCEKCERLLYINTEAYICSYECTFCKKCAEELGHCCPSCHFELVRRPKRKRIR